MRYGLIGKNLSHSFSKEVHEKLAPYNYELIELDEKELAAFMKTRDFAAVNVTIPYKEKVMPYLDVIDEHAKEIGAVNTVINQGGKLYGYNTDFGGFCGLVAYSEIDVKGKTVLVLGNGGTSKTVVAACKSLGVNKIYVASRKKNAENLTPDDYKDFLDAEVIVNTTPVGMYPDIHKSPVELSQFKKLEGVIDAVYNPLRTKLYLDAKAAKIKAVCGLYMLVRQAVLAVELFTGEKIKYNETERVYNEIMHQKENIVLIGMPGCGKSTIGAVVASMTGREFVDVDTAIEKKYGPVSYLLKTKGEDAFRTIEEAEIADISSRTGVVVATGGGAIVRPQNIYSLKSNGKIFFLDRSVELIMPSDDRPLSSNKDALLSLYGRRYSDYKKSADVKIDGDGSIKETAEMVIHRFNRSSSDKIKILVIDGPNMNLLGIREPNIYGKESYADLCDRIRKHADEIGVKVELFQSNHEGAIIDKIQAAMGVFDGIVINPAAYTHTSIAIADALRATSIPSVEVHVSNVDEREDYRKVNFIRPVCFYSISGKGGDGYIEALDKIAIKFK